MTARTALVRLALATVILTALAGCKKKGPTEPGGVDHAAHTTAALPVG